MSQISKLEKFLVKNKKNALTTAKIAASIKIPRDAVRKVVYDLRQEGYKIVSGTTKVRGKTVNTYQLAS